MDNIEELKPTIAKYRYNNDDKFALDLLNDMSERRNIKRKSKVTSSIV